MYLVVYHLLFHFPMYFPFLLAPGEAEGAPSPLPLKSPNETTRCGTAHETGEKKRSTTTERRSIRESREDSHQKAFLVDVLDVSCPTSVVRSTSIDRRRR